MSRREIAARFDEIVAFAEVDKFIDTPVKHYSSGMYVRLAFAVAAHLEPEILIVDEVLAVGDAAFQKKCLGRMDDVSREGKTVLFVSHNMAAVQKLCTRGILLEKGTLTLDGGTEECIGRYLHRARSGNAGSLCYSVMQDALGAQAPDGRVRVTSIEMLDLHGLPLQRLRTNEGFTVRMRYVSRDDFAPGAISFMVSIKTHLGSEICRLNTMPLSGYRIESIGRAGLVELTVKSLPLVGGGYFMDIRVFRQSVETILQLTEVVAFEVEPTDVYNSGVAMDQSRGLFVVEHRWNHQLLETTDGSCPVEKSA
jgi:lipopolysaccharide transport system ATP-binding protein